MSINQTLNIKWNINKIFTIILSNHNGIIIQLNNQNQLAGHETSSMMLAWAVYELSRHPAALARVRAEASKLPSLTETNDFPDANDLKNDLAYTEVFSLIFFCFFFL